LIDIKRRHAINERPENCHNSFSGIALRVQGSFFAFNFRQIFIRPENLSLGSNLSALNWRRGTVAQNFSGNGDHGTH
jgi:hypothetical protein